MSVVHFPPPHRPKPKGQNKPLEEEKKETKGPVLKKGKLKIGLDIKKPWYIYLGGLVLILALVGLYSFQDRIPLSSVAINWADGSENSFINQDEVLDQVIPGGEAALLGMPLKEVDLATIEANLNAHPTIQHVEAHKSFTGSLKLQVELRQAVGRLVSNSGQHLYIDPNGVKFPTSSHLSAYVPLVRGDFEEGLVDTFSCETVFDAVPVLDYISKDEFWKAQIAEVIVEQSGELVMLPSIGNTRIEFGYPVRIGEKFSNLMDFYKQVIPVRGWDEYKSVSLKYRGQVVGKKR
ncbi:MAG: hypothetical protein MRZ79_26555 [Bacteroidia bacterium]|nr:hypothetical protein [Bacteroidia bacterium]